MTIKDFDFNSLIEKAVKEKCEITVSIEPGRTEITIQPWKPFSYTCPHAHTIDPNPYKTEFVPL